MDPRRPWMEQWESLPTVEHGSDAAPVAVAGDAPPDRRHGSQQKREGCWREQGEAGGSGGLAAAWCVGGRGEDNVMVYIFI